MEFLTNKELFIIIFILAIILINISLFSALKRNKDGSTFQILKKSINSVKDPFKKDNQQFEELSNLVKNLKNDEKNNLNHKEIE